MNTIKLYFNAGHLLIAQEAPRNANQYSKLIEHEEDVNAFLADPGLLFDPGYNQDVLLLTHDASEALESVFNYAQGIVAAGGLVKNEQDELLIIHRRGFWDLPKGKVEKGEMILNAAKREVEEETGVKVGTIISDAFLTYHCYTLKGKKCIKETHWYNMMAAPGQSNLIPQTEEDIEQVLWASKQKIFEVKDQFYPLIRDLIAQQFHLVLNGKV